MNSGDLQLGDLDGASGGTNWLSVVGNVMGALAGFGGYGGNRGGYYDVYDDRLGGYVIEDVGYGLGTPGYGYGYGSPLVGTHSSYAQYPQLAQYSQYGQYGRPYDFVAVR